MIWQCKNKYTNKKYRHTHTHTRKISLEEHQIVNSGYVRVRGLWIFFLFFIYPKFLM